MKTYLKRLFSVLGTVMLLMSGFLLPVRAEDHVREYTPQDIPYMQSAAVCLMEAESGQIILDVQDTEKRAPASVTKVLTYLTASKYLDPESRVTITGDMLAGLIELDASVAGLTEGSEPTVRDLYYALLLPSGADAAMALAYTVSGSVEGFMEEMNRTAQEIGMNDSHFVNPTGLDEEGQYSTALDLAVMMRKAIEDTTFMEIIGCEEYTTTTGLVVTSTVPSNVAGMKGFLGGKTGYTLNAGRCLASNAVIDGTHLILVTLGAGTFGNFIDAETIYTWFGDTIEKKTLLEAQEWIGQVEIKDTYPKKTLDVYAGEEVTMYLPKDAVIETEVTYMNPLIAPVSVGDTVGEIRITADGQEIYSGTLLAEEKISANPVLHFYRVYGNKGVAAVAILGVLIVGAILYILRLKQKLRKKKKKNCRN